jgi:probable rRNA maturation factor
MDAAIQIDEPFLAHITPEIVERALQAVWSVCSPGLNAASAGSVAVVITDTEAIRQLNRQYRGVDAPTDVLSFENTPDPDFPPVESPPHLGDIIIACPVAEAQAQAAGHTTSQEITLLVVHGALHLLGFDHDTPSPKNKMWAIQQQIMAALDLAHILPTER